MNERDSDRESGEEAVFWFCDRSRERLSVKESCRTATDCNKAEIRGGARWRSYKGPVKARGFEADMGAEFGALVNGAVPRPRALHLACPSPHAVRRIACRSTHRLVTSGVGRGRLQERHDGGGGRTPRPVRLRHCRPHRGCGRPARAAAHLQAAAITMQSAQSGHR